MADWGASGSEWGVDPSSNDASAQDNTKELESLLDSVANVDVKARKTLVAATTKNDPKPQQQQAVKKSAKQNLTVELGFVEEPFSNEELDRKFFPSKIGGKPAWLVPNPLPTAADLTCPECSLRMNFVMQVYSPLDDKDHAFHRMLFVFWCHDGRCHAKNPDSIRVFRVQLPRDNTFYSNEPPKTEDSAFAKPASSRVPDSMAVDPELCDSTCIVCGQVANQACSKCHIKYCSKEHQTLDWKTRHKALCQELQNNKQATMKKLNVLVGTPFVYKQLELCIEEDSSAPANKKKQQNDDTDDDSDDDDSDDDNQTPLHPDDETDELKGLEQAARELDKTDKAFLDFQKAISAAPDQVLRYSVGRCDNAALHVMGVVDGDKGRQKGRAGAKERPKVEVPACAACGKSRVFEMQIMPQLLYFLELDDLAETAIDFGTLLIYTCPDSCCGGAAYAKEFVCREAPDE